MDPDFARIPSPAQTDIVGALVREIWHPKARRRCADKIATTLNRTFGIDPQQFPPSGQDAAKELRDRGITFPNLGLPQSEVQAIRSHLLQRRSPLGPDAPVRHYHSVRDIVEAPRLLELALSDQVLAPLANYFGTMPFLTGVRTWWLENGPPLDGDQVAHRDNLDVCFCKLFIYLTDVTANDAPHKFFTGTHNYAYVKRKLLDSGVPQSQLPTALQYVFEANFDKLKSDIVELFKNDAVTITGGAGTSFLADTWAIHRAGIPAPGHHRLIFSAIYGMNLDPTDYEAMTELRTLPGWRERVGASPLAQHAVLPWT